MKKRKKITKFKTNPKDVMKANRRGSREAELELNSGFPKSHSVHKNDKSYSRKKKHKEDF